MMLDELNSLPSYLEKLEDEWDSYKSKKPPKESIKKYKTLLRYLKKKKFNFELITHAGACVTWPGVGITIETDDFEYVIELLEYKNIITKIQNSDLVNVYYILGNCNISIAKIIDHMEMMGLFKTKETNNVG